MPHIPLRYAPRLIWHGTKNFFSSRPIVVSFETTLSCNADCKHCDLSGGIPDETRMAPEKYRDYVKRFMPPVIQLSGGEPFLRRDLLDIVKNVKLSPFFPYAILVSNGWMLTEEKYLTLREAGVNQFSVSLDFPDTRHDDFRAIKGLFERLDRNIPTLARHGHGDVVLNTAITSANIRELPAIVETARRWGVCMSFSIYTPLRTGNRDYVVAHPDDVAYMEEIFSKCRRKEPPFDTVVNSGYNLDGLLRFVREGEIPNCSAGKRFLVVRPDGQLNPCSLQRIQFDTQQNMLEDFCQSNTCGGCYVSIRSYVEISFPKLLWENVSMRVFNSNSREA